MAIPEDIAKLQNWSRSKGVRYHLDGYENRLYLGSFSRDGNEFYRPVTDGPRGKGRRHLKLLCTLCDEHKLPIELGTNVSKLMTMYLELGFVVTDARYGRMRREARGKYNARPKALD